MTYQLVLSGHGMEIVTGSISKETYNYFKSNQISIEDFVSGSVTVPEHLMPFKENAWFECDDVAHLHNVEFQENNKLIISKNEKVIHELNLDTSTLEKLDIEVDYDEIYIAEAASDTYRFIGKSYEKGTFFSTHIDEKTFDIKQIKIDYLDIEGHEVVSSISYQGNTLVTQEVSTVGQSTEFQMFDS